MAKRNRKYDAKKLEWLRDSKKFILFLVVAVIIFRVLIGISRVDGLSMYPTLKDGQAIVYSRLSKNYEVGDIVSVKMPGGQYYIKRVVAVGGDTVDIKDGLLYVNGKAQTQYGYGETEAQSALVHYPLTVQEGHIFAVGDNRPVSIDSRTFGEMAISQTRGKIFFYLNRNG